MKKNSFTQHHFNINQSLRKGSFQLNFFSKNGAGFTLLEAIFAISILVLTVTGSLALISRLLSFSPQVQSKLIASYLAQEGIEVVRNIRDNNWLNPANPSWNDGLGNGDYEADYTNTTLSSWGDRFLNIDSAGFYSYSTTPPFTQTKFKRKITLTQILPDEVGVLVEVSWQEKGQTQSVKVMENLYNWK